MIILCLFLIAVLSFIAKLIYDVQQNKKNPKPVSDEIDLELKDRFQTLAGIKPHDSNKGRNDLVKVLERADEITKDGFLEPDPSIRLGYQSDDPFSEIPMSRVSKEAKQKMAEIAIEDIKLKLEEKAVNITETNGI